MRSTTLYFIANIWLVVVGCSFSLQTAAAIAQDANEKPVLLFDFEQPGLSDGWSAIKQLTVARKPLPVAPGPAPGEWVSGYGIQLSTTGEGGFYTKPGRLLIDWTRCSSLEFWVYRDANLKNNQAPCIVETQFFEADGKTCFWRKVVLGHIGWKKMTVPLQWCRWGEGRIPDWSKIERLGFFLRNAGEVWIDGIAVVPGKGISAILPVDEMRKVAFPGPTDTVRLRVGKYALVVTDASELQVNELLKHLDHVAETVLKDLPYLEKPTRPVPVVVFETQEEYQAFPPRLAERLNSEARPPQSAGFTIAGIGTSSWSVERGSLRPIYTHQFVNALLAESARIDNRGEWFPEGLAASYQLRFHPEESIREVISTGIADESLHQSLEQLTCGDPLPLNRHWQAMTLVETLLFSKRYAPHAEKLVLAMSESGDARLQPYLKPVLNTTWEELTADWREYCKTAYRTGNKAD